MSAGSPRRRASIVGQGGAQDGRRRIVAVGVGQGDDREVESSSDLVDELELVAHPAGGDDPGIGRGDAERTVAAHRASSIDGVIEHGESVPHPPRRDPGWYTPWEYECDRPPPTEIHLPIEGMTCASCVNRIERFLRETDGVETASVNLATERATIRYLPDVAGRAALVGAVEAAGYDVRAQPERAADATATTLAADVALAEDARARARSATSCCVQARRLDRGRRS